MESSTDVLVVGAGPTGLFLALVLARLGVRAQVVDAADGPGTTSRALAVQARTLEIYQQLGLAKDVLDRALVLGAVNLWRRGEHAARVDLTSAGKGLSPYPFGVIFPQDEHEALLVARLEAEGVRVRRRTTIDAIAERGGSVVASGRGPDGAPVTFEARYVAGCDGARSVVRSSIEAGFPGGTYEHLFYVADVTAHGAPMNKELHVFLDVAGFLALFPLAGEGRARLVGTVRESSARNETLTWDDADHAAIERIGVAVDRVAWFSTYHVHHRVADRFRRGRAFLLGDAGHVHSPVGGQGMNTGLGDAMNLAWKLSAVLGGRANADLLDTYEHERIAFARRLVATTDRAFKAASSDGPFAEWVRTQLVPAVVPRALGVGIARHLLFEAVSQIGIEYRDSPWSEGRAGAVRAGDRLPWASHAGTGEEDNFAPLTSLDWQVHVYGAPPSGLASACETSRLALHSFPPAEEASLQIGAVYLVRPDGYLGGVFKGHDATQNFVRYLEVHGIRARAAANGRVRS
ncbi:MAG TPA: FAD-dependent monooxygenase [Polyangiaceae bacterium]|nr:FAD-dependent monooxygenase [Polyangiaceae bacterium]